MIQAIIDGEPESGLLADMAKGLLRNKISELQSRWRADHCAPRSCWHN